MGTKNLKRLSIFTLIFLFIIVACGQTKEDDSLDGEETAVSISPTPVEATPTVVEATATATSSPTETAVPTDLPTASPTPIIDDLAIAPENVFLYPVPQIYTDDRVSIQVFPQVPDVVAVETVTLHIYVDGAELAASQLSWGSLASRPQAVVEWAWQRRWHNCRAGS